MKSVHMTAVSPPATNTRVYMYTYTFEYTAPEMMRQPVMVNMEAMTRSKMMEVYTFQPSAWPMKRAPAYRSACWKT